MPQQKELTRLILRYFGKNKSSNNNIPSIVEKQIHKAPTKVVGDVPYKILLSFTSQKK